MCQYYDQEWAQEAYRQLRDGNDEEMPLTSGANVVANATEYDLHIIVEEDENTCKERAKKLSEARTEKDKQNLLHGSTVLESQTFTDVFSPVHDGGIFITAYTDRKGDLKKVCECLSLTRNQSVIASRDECIRRTKDGYLWIDEEFKDHRWWETD